MLSSEILVIDPVDCQQGTLDLTHVPQCLGETALPRGRRQSLEHERGTDSAGAQRGHHARNIVPVRPDPVGVDAVGVDAVAHDILKNAIMFSRPKAIETLPIEIGNARHESKVERMAECEDEIADAAAIDVMANDV